VIPFPDAGWDQQIEIPDAVARNLDFNTGYAIGVAAAATEDCASGGMMGCLVGDGIILSRRHRSVSIAARLMGVSVDGLRGILAGAAEHGYPLFQVPTDGDGAN
jgi:hypothetical protein